MKSNVVARLEVRGQLPSGERKQRDVEQELYAKMVNLYQAEGVDLQKHQVNVSFLPRLGPMRAGNSFFFFTAMSPCIYHFLRGLSAERLLASTGLLQVGFIAGGRGWPLAAKGETIPLGHVFPRFFLFFYLLS